VRKLPRSSNLNAVPPQAFPSTHTSARYSPKTLAPGTLTGTSYSPKPLLPGIRTRASSPPKTLLPGIRTRASSPPKTLLPGIHTNASCSSKTLARADGSSETRPRAVSRRPRDVRSSCIIIGERRRAHPQRAPAAPGEQRRPRSLPRAEKQR